MNLKWLTDSFLSAGIGWFSRDKLLILIYHRVHKQAPPLSLGDPDAKEFDWQMRLLHRYFNPLALPDAVKLLYEKRLPPRSVVITFDDGYRDNHDVALPILKKYGIPATFFIATGYLNGGIMWNDMVIDLVSEHSDNFLDLSAYGLGEYKLSGTQEREQAISAILHMLKYRHFPERIEKILAISEKLGKSFPIDLMMNDSHVQKLRKEGMTIGAHTVNHPILAVETANLVKQEITLSKEKLESLTNHPVSYFAYPNGKAGIDYNKRDRDIVAMSGFEAAVSTDWGINTQSTDHYALRRFTPWDRTPEKYLLRLMRNYW